MKILSIDTSSNICGVSILEDTKLLCKLDTNTGRTHSENLMPMIKNALEQTNLSLKDINLLVCDKGPGSFTGIRIGIATIKAFHDCLSIPCTGVSALEALAYGVKEDGLIASIIDCKNNNCYFAVYERKNAIYQEITTPAASSIAEAIKSCKQIASTNLSITFVGDACNIYKDFIAHEFSNKKFKIYDQNSILDSYLLGLAGWNKYKSQQLEDVLPLYLKKPQAQRQAEEKLKSIQITNMTLEDLNEISHILASDFDDFWSFNTLKDELCNENSTYLIAKLQNQIVGFAGIKVLLDEANIMNIVVNKSFRNQGIGSLLLQKLICLAKNKDLNSITLEVKEENNSAIHLYKNFGFKNVGIRKNYYQDKNGLIMTKKLT